MKIDELLNKINIKQDIRPIPKLQIGDGKLKKRFDIQIGWKKFTIIVRW